MPPKGAFGVLTALETRGDPAPHSDPMLDYEPNGSRWRSPLHTAQLHQSKPYNGPGPITASTLVGAITASESRWRNHSLTM